MFKYYIKNSLLELWITEYGKYPKHHENVIVRWAAKGMEMPQSQQRLVINISAVGNDRVVLSDVNKAKAWPDNIFEISQKDS